MSDMEKLIERLEAATGPDRELDAAILVQTRVGWSDRQYWNWRGCLPKGDEANTELDYARDRAKNFTSSIDAALTLVPKGDDWKVGFNGHAHAWAKTGIAGMATATTPALALCIAALRARSRSGGGG